MCMGSPGGGYISPEAIRALPDRKPEPVPESAEDRTRRMFPGLPPPPAAPVDDHDARMRKMFPGLPPPPPPPPESITSILASKDLWAAASSGPSKKQFTPSLATPQQPQSLRRR